MIDFTPAGDNLINIHGSHCGVSVHGVAHKVLVRGNQKKVWHYDLCLVYGGTLERLKSNEHEGTMWNDELLKHRVIRLCVDVGTPHNYCDCVVKPTTTTKCSGRLVFVPALSKIICDTCDYAQAVTL